MSIQIIYSSSILPLIINYILLLIQSVENGDKGHITSSKSMIMKVIDRREFVLIGGS